jgi:predicted nicotinamide N-methyase
MSLREPDVVVTVRMQDKNDRDFKLYEDVHVGGPGGRLWDASVLMARHLGERVDGSLHNANVIEIGAGLGLPGIVAAHQGAHVTLTVMIVL